MVGAPVRVLRERHPLLAVTGQGEVDLVLHPHAFDAPAQGHLLGFLRHLLGEPDDVERPGLDARAYLSETIVLASIWTAYFRA
jgi:hypothetical protein